MTQTIEQLTTRVRELEEELERKMSAGRYVLEQLSASQLHAEQLREALELLNKASDIGCCLVDKALALPRDTNALDAYVAESREAAYREARRAAAQFEAELARQRDLAIDALERLEHSFDFGEIAGIEPEACGRAKKFITNTISTIKESEAMAQGEKK